MAEAQPLKWPKNLKLVPGEDPTVFVAAWSRIDTAPKTEQVEVLLYSPRYGVFVGMLLGGKWARSSSREYTPHDDFFGDGDLGVTHWMPLPEPPK